MPVKNPFAYFAENKREWQVLNVLLFLIVCGLMSVLLGFSLGPVLTTLSAFSIPAALVYRAGKPALDSMFNDYFLKLPTKDLIFLAKIQVLIVVGMIITILIKRFKPNFQLILSKLFP